jgi:AcrR family transcriptional regulator
VARWESGSRERLAEAALRLFTAQGFERTTVADIAAAAGLTERTFFRYYADKPEVLFAGQDEFAELFIEGLRGSDSTEPMDLVAAAVSAAAAFFRDERRAWSRDRQVVVSANIALSERELHKMAALVDALADALVERGVEPLAAALAAEAGVSVFRRSFAAWISDGETRSFEEIQAEVFGRLRRLVSDAG